MADFFWKCVVAVTEIYFVLNVRHTALTDGYIIYNHLNISDISGLELIDSEQMRINYLKELIYLKRDLCVCTEKLQSK